MYRILVLYMIQVLKSCGSPHPPGNGMVPRSRGPPHPPSRQWYGPQVLWPPPTPQAMVSPLLAARPQLRYQPQAQSQAPFQAQAQTRVPGPGQVRSQD